MNRATLYTSANILLYATSFLGQAAPITVAGTLDTSFNPSGFSISSTGASVDFGGYAGSLIIDLGGNDYGLSVDSFNFAAQGNRIILGGRTDTGPNPPNFALVVLTPSGALDNSFNPSGLTIQADGSLAKLSGLGYPGSLIIDLGGGDNFGSVADVFSFSTQGDRIILGGRTDTGPNPPNFALVVLTPTGALDNSFNPSGLTIQADGSSTKLSGLGYPGSLIIDLGAADLAYSTEAFNFTTQGERILLGGRTNTGPNPFNFALIALTPTGLLDSSFNPSGLTIQADGSSADLGGYAGSLIIDLGGSDFASSADTFNFISQGDRILLGGNTTTGSTEFVFSFALTVLTSTGSLDMGFNPSGLTITATGLSVNKGGYAGSIIIELGEDFSSSTKAFNFTTQGDRILLGGRTNTGPNPFNFALFVLTPTGLLDNSFNPSGLTIREDGSSADLGGYAGSLVIDFGGSDYEQAISAFKFSAQEDRILLGGFTSTGPIPFNFVSVALTPAGALDTSFNPSGLTITATGLSIDLGGYAGSLIIDLGGLDYAYSADAFNLINQNDRIVFGGFTNAGPGFPGFDFALVALHGSTRFPPQPIVVGPLANLPFIAMAAA